MAKEACANQKVFVEGLKKQLEAAKAVPAGKQAAKKAGRVAKIAEQLIEQRVWPPMICMLISNANLCAAAACSM